MNVAPMLHSAKLIHRTEDAEKLIAYCARVSNPPNQNSDNIAGLLRYCAKHGHWSIFEMASMCVEIYTTRAIAPQILRHGKAFSFQEFSQRYAPVDLLPEVTELPELRRQDDKNRQNSIAPTHQRELPWVAACNPHLPASCGLLRSGPAQLPASASQPSTATSSPAFSDQVIEEVFGKAIEAGSAALLRGLEKHPKHLPSS